MQPKAPLSTVTCRCSSGCATRGCATRIWTCTHGLKCSILLALEHSNLHVADWVEAHGGVPLVWPTLHLLGEQWLSAVRSGSMESVRWLLRHGMPVHSSAVGAAAEAGNLEVVQLLHVRFGVPLTTEVFSKAASSGSVPTATWLLRTGCPMSPEAYQSAAGKGDVDMVLWLAREAGCPWGDSTLSAVISKWPAGSKDSATLLAAVRALVKAGCPHAGGTVAGSSTCNAAARGDLLLLRYLHEELGVAFGPGIMAAAAQGGCEVMLEWLVQEGCELSTPT